ncbi:MAG TPA: hypothetical protein VKA60_04030 [Blastocatellia bacterium]|nr:hypothetical protein [Blastocatellia bacterium]
MKSTARLFIVALALAAIAYGQEQPGSRFAKLEITDDDQFNHRLLLNDKEALKYEGLSLQVYDVLQGRGVDYLIMQANTGGSGCPFRLFIVEVYKSGAYKVSEEFGSCYEPDSARLVKGSVVVETPGFVGHPELLSKREVRRRERTKEVYTWYRGTLTKKTRPR